jgi:PAS domain S-box-containing protein
MLVAVGAPGQAAATDWNEVPQGLSRFRSFGTAEGLHNLVVGSITQDADGFLWVGTEDGVARFDGERFTHFGTEQGLLSTDTAVIGIAPDGKPCVGGRAGMACWDGMRFSRAGTAGLPAVAVSSIVTAGDRLWVATADGLYVRDRGRDFVRAPGWPAATAATALWVDAGGVVAGEGGRVLAGAGDGAWRELSVGLAGDRIDGILRDRGGALWIRSAKHMWHLARGAVRAEDLIGGFPVEHQEVGPGGGMVNGPLGEVWFASDAGVVYRDGERWRLIDRNVGLLGTGARALFIDRAGTMWVGAIGLVQWRGRSLIERFDAGNGLPGDVGWSVGRDPEGALWFGTNRCLVRARMALWECLRGSEGREVRGFAFPPHGGVFLGGSPAELVYVDRSGTAVSMGIDVAHPTERKILALKLGPTGDLWIATTSGLFRLAGAVPGTIERVTIPGIANDARFSSLIVAEGRLWSGTSEGLVELDGHTWHLHGAAEGLRSQSTRYLVYAGDHRYCATYTDAIGLSCFEVRGHVLSNLEHIGVAEGLITGAVYFIGVDRAHRLWVGTGDGVDVITSSGIEHFSEADGLAGDDAAATAFFEDPDGSVWMGMTGGASHFHAERYGGPPPPPRALIRGARLGDQIVHPHDPAGLVTPHDRSALQVELGSDRLADAGRIEYQVRLSPLEPEWSATLARQARYPALLPGAYVLEIRARMDTGIWGPVTGLPFSVRAAWWQTRAFLIAAGLAVLVSFGLAFTWRQRAVLQRRIRQLNEESTASVRAMLELIPDLISVHRDGKVIYANLAARRIYGTPAGSEVAGLGERIHPDDRARVASVMQAPAATPGVEGVPEVVELRVRDDDGGWRICEVSGVWIELAGATVLVASGRDVTERHRLRAQLLVSDRMASLGTLAAGIAHEINNPLSYVLGNLQMMSESATSPAELAAAIGDATDGAQRVRKIVQGLRSFSRAEEESRIRLALPDVLRAAIRLTANEVRHRAQLVYELGDTPKVVADDGRLTQVFINLIVNAAHAIPEGHSDDNRITVRTRSDDDGHAVIEIEDTGRGMPPEVQARAFDPFFTTKEVGGGTGLGLSICHGIISALGGRISIESAVGRGTVVRVVLPPAAQEAAPARLTTPPVAAAQQRLRVLVVDDEPLVVDMLARVLRRDHEVVAVSCGRDALEQVGAGVWFDAIVSDVMMPNMTGIELLEALVRLDPVQARRLIFLSGGVFTPETRARLDALGTLQLEKPVGTKDLRRAVMSVAASGGAAAAAMTA